MFSDFAAKFTKWAAARRRCEVLRLYEAATSTAAGCSGATADERGGTAAGAGGGADAARGREQDGLLRREPPQSRQA
eukprot:scaffold41471_cov85-Phaeocystis_antarctica.AAC.2